MYGIYAYTNVRNLRLYECTNAAAVKGKGKGNEGLEIYKKRVLTAYGGLFCIRRFDLASA